MTPASRLHCPSRSRVDVDGALRLRTREVGECDQMGTTRQAVVVVEASVDHQHE